MNKSASNLIFGSFIALLSTGCSLFGKNSVEEAKYKVIVHEDRNEIRLYSSAIVAKTTIRGPFKEAQNDGFRLLAGYIFGKNKSNEKIAMTAPVVQTSKSEKIAMTAPVVMSPGNDKEWTMTFTMPSKYTLETLPVPTDKRVQIERSEERSVAAVTFTGLWSEETNREKAEQLKDWLKKFPEYEITSGPMFAGYNPPWTLPFFRRNEMLFEIKKKQ